MSPTSNERVAIVGSRTASAATLDKVRDLVLSLPANTVVISGGAVGVDQTATEAALARGLSTLQIRPVTVNIPGRQYIAIMSRVDDDIEEDPHMFFYHTPSMRDALIFRNTIIAIECTRMVAFVENSRGGTWDAVNQAKRFRRPCEVIQ